MLQLFADGAGESGTAEPGATGESAVDAAPHTKGRRQNPLAGVKYGIQDRLTSDSPEYGNQYGNPAETSGRGENAQVAAVQKEAAENGRTDSQAKRNAEFNRLVRGEFKDIYDARMEETVKNRLKGSKETVEKYNSLLPVLETLGRKYGVDASDTQALSKAIEEDDSFYEEEALEKGISVKELKEIRRMEKENAELKRQLDEQRARENADRLVAEWIDQGEKLKEIYPSFNLDSEMENPKFTDLLRVPGVDVRTAYELIHKDDIIAGAMQFTAQTVEKKLADKIRAGGVRPAENGMNSQAASLVKSDVSQLTKADRAEIIRRVSRGERIRF